MLLTLMVSAVEDQNAPIIHSIEEARTLVMAHAGTSNSRDAVDKRVKNQTGKLNSLVAHDNSVKKPELHKRIVTAGQDKIAKSQNPQKGREVVIKKSKKGWILLRSGEPYYVRGVGGQIQLQYLATNGGNSIRTWRTGPKTKELMDKADKLGLTVCLGLWMDHERHGFDYNNTDAVQRQFNAFKKYVEEFKDHPALLMWGVGNEVETNYTNPKVWDAMNAICKMIKKVDGKHPTLTALAWPSNHVIKEILQRVPNVDILGLNSYAGLKESLHEGQKHGWKGPTIVTEYGPNGFWEMPKTSWGSYLEMNSSDKAKLYGERTDLIKNDQNCLGGYAFLWGEKQERTRTWFSLIFNGKNISAGVDELIKSWTNKYPRNQAPNVTKLVVNDKLAEKNVELMPRQIYVAKVNVTDDNSEKLKYQWELRHETVAQSIGGDIEEIPPEVEGSIVKIGTNGTLKFKAPNQPGKYRLFVYVVDTQHKIGHANFPFIVR